METREERETRLWGIAQRCLKDVAPELNRQGQEAHTRLWQVFINNKLSINCNAVNLPLMNSGLLCRDRMPDSFFDVYWRCWGTPCPIRELQSDQAAKAVERLRKEYGFIFAGHGGIWVVKKGGKTCRHILGFDPDRVKEPEPSIGRKVPIPKDTSCTICREAPATEWDHRIPREVYRKRNTLSHVIENLPQIERERFFQPVCKACNMLKKGQCDKCQRGQRPRFPSGLLDVEQWVSKWKLGECETCPWSADRTILLAPGTDPSQKNDPAGPNTVWAPKPIQHNILDLLG